MDAIFKALNDPARRALLDSLREQDGQTLTELETRVALSRFGVMKHLGVLEAAHLIVTRKEGRFKYHYLNAAPLQEVIDRWIEPLLVKPTTLGVLALKAQLEGKNDMPKPSFITSTYIRCTQEALWDALRNAESAMQYDFFGRTVTRDGDALIYTMPDGALNMRAVDIEVVPMTKIVTTFEPTWEANPSKVTFLIKPQGDYCCLTVEHTELTHEAPPGSGTADGWHRSLAGLKTWLETGTAVAFGGAGLYSDA